MTAHQLFIGFNLGIALSYFLIPIGLMRLLIRLRKYLTWGLGSTLLAFGGFIFSCAIGHLFGAFGSMEHGQHSSLMIWIHGVTFLISFGVACAMPKIGDYVIEFVQSKAEMARCVQEREALFRAFLDSPSIIAWLKDSETLCHTYNNQTLEETFGGSKVGLRDDDWLPHDVAETTIANDLEILRTGVAKELVEIVPDIKGVRRIWRSTKFIVQVWGKTYVGGIAVDSTAEQTAKEQLERANQELEQFAYAASHDLKTPLRGISGLLSILERKLSERLDDAERNILQQILKDCAYANELVGGILNYSRIGRSPLERKVINPAAILERVIDRLNDRIEATQAHISWSELPTFLADETQISQVFENLIENALKYRSEAIPQIEISADHFDKWWVFSVRDNGLGVDPEYHTELFRMFKRLHGQGEIEGTGIGLATVRKIAQLHGGNAWVESRGEGCGSTFKFSVVMP